MKSREQLVARALQELSVVGAGQAPSAEDAKTVDDEVGPLMSDLALRRVYAGMRALFFDAGTTTPRTTYRDAALSISHDHPVVANGSGVFPAIYLADGAPYRVRLQTADGVAFSDWDGISIPGMTTGGGGGETPSEMAVTTGDVVFRYDTSARAGWVRANGRTIGGGASGATERANADTQALFSFLWERGVSVVGGRGSTASSDFLANKQLTLPDLRGRLVGCVDDFGAGVTNRIPAALLDNSASFTSLGASGGVASVTLTLDQIPAHNHGGATGAAGSHSHIYQRGSPTQAASSGGTYNAENANIGGDTATSTVGDHAHTIAAQGGGQMHTNLPPVMALGAYIRL